VLVSIIRDITERRRAEDVLQATEEWFAEVFQSSPAAMTITTVEEGRFIHVSDAFLTLSGYTRDELIGKTSMSLGSGRFRRTASGR